MYAYTVDDLTRAGWEEVTSLPTSNAELGKYYYVFWETQADLMLAEENGEGKEGDEQEKQLTGVYRTPTDPASDNTKVWILEYNATYLYGIRNLSKPQLLLQSRDNATYRVQAAWERMQSIWTQWNLVYEDSKWAIQNKLPTDKGGGDNNWIGPWNKDAFQNNMVVAGNAGGNGNKKGLFKIYRKLRVVYHGITYNYATATAASPLDVTGLIANASFDHVTSGWDIAGDFANAFNTTYSTFEAYHRVSGVSQNLTNIPNGKYAVSVQVACRNDNSEKSDDQLPKLTATSAFKAVSAISSAVPESNFENTAKKMSEDARYGKISVDVNVTDGSLNIALNETNNNTWPVYDNFKLYYYGPTVAGNAIALPDGGAMEAGQWYFFDITTAAENYKAVAATLDDIIFTTEGSALIENESVVSHQFTAENNSLEATRYYVKSSSAQSLVVARISEASADVSFIQAGKTVTVSYTTSCNEPGATMTQDYSGVTFGGNAVSVTPTASGFTFTVPEVAANAEYILAIPAGAIKYNEGVKNAAQNITLKTPAVFDGIYYFYNTDTHKYMSRGNTWGTQAVTDDYGLPAYLAFDGEGKTNVKFFDNYKFLSDGGWLYADFETGGAFFVEAVSGGYKFKDATTGKYVAIYVGLIVGDAEEGGNLQGSSNIWALETPAQFKAKDNPTALANAQAAAAATAAGISGITTLAALESELAANYLESPIAITGAKAEQYDQNAGGGEGGVLQENEYVKETVSSLQPGLYRLTVDAFQRASSNVRTAAADGARSLVYVYAGSAKTQLKSVMEYGAAEAYASDYENNGKHYPNNEASGYVALETGNYKNTVYVYLADAGDLTFGINNPQNSKAEKDHAVWAIYENFSLVHFKAKATEAERQALDEAISNAEANLGFEAGQYAPYNNLEGIAKLNAAKGIDLDNTLGTDVVAATTELNNAWTANDVEVNAFYGGDFTQYETKDKKDYPYGWNLYNGADNHSRIMGGSEGTGNNGLTASSSGKALLLKYNATYGESEGYTMPLKAGKIYKITFKHGRWNEANPRLTDVVMTDPSGASITLAPAFQAKNNSCESNAANWETYTGYFVSTTAGNYKFNLTKQGGNSQMQIGIADIDLRTASELEFADGTVPTYAPGTYPLVKITRNLTAERWATAVYPFAVSGVDDIAVLDSYNASTGVLGFKSATASTANVPFLMRSTAGATAITVSNVAVAAAAATDAKASEASLKGTYAAVDVNAGEGVYNYVLSNNTIYKVGQNAATINPYRAYIQLTQSADARALSFFIDSDTTTGIDGITVEGANDGPVFSLSGQRVKSPRKGLYIMNGRKVFVK